MHPRPATEKSNGDSSEATERGKSVAPNTISNMNCCGTHLELLTVYHKPRASPATLKINQKRVGKHQRQIN